MKEWGGLIFGTGTLAMPWPPITGSPINLYIVVCCVVRWFCAVSKEHMLHSRPSINSYKLNSNPAGHLFANWICTLVACLIAWLFASYQLLFLLALFMFVTGIRRMMNTCANTPGRLCLNVLFPQIGNDTETSAVSTLCAVIAWANLTRIIYLFSLFAVFLICLISVELIKAFAKPFVMWYLGGWSPCFLD